MSFRCGFNLAKTIKILIPCLRIFRPTGKSSKQNDFQRRGNVLPFRPTSPTSIINSTSPQSCDELSSSLLQTGSGDAKENMFFGHFKGFSLTPLGKTGDETSPSSNAPPINLNNDRRNGKNIALVHPTTKVQDPSKAPVRSAPPVPQAPVIKNNSVGKMDIPKKQTKNTVHWDKSTIEDLKPALPPLNPGSHARPLISEPILEGSTCTRKELISPLKHSNSIPIRSAPEVPPAARPQSTGDILENPASDIKKLTKENSNNALNRIASFLNKDKSKSQSNTSTLTRTSRGNKNLDLKNLQISNPILQQDIVLPDGTVCVMSDSEDDDCGRTMVTRSKSMRSPSSPQRPNIPNFGSMRQPSGSRRPTTISTNTRPNRPPPPRPDYTPDKEKVNKKLAELDKLAAASDYQVPIQRTVEFYDDEAIAPLANISEELTPSSNDNIYAVIEENSPPKSKEDKNLLSPQSIKSVQSGSSESVGLLGEIVNEIQHRNFDSIYSTSTLKKNGKDTSYGGGYASDSDSSQAIYVNTGPDSEYMNTAPSTTSSGYVNPQSINISKPDVEPEKNTVSSIKQALDAKASASSIPKGSSKQTSSIQSTKSGNSKQTTPPTSFKPSAAKSTTMNPKSTLDSQNKFSSKSAPSSKLVNGKPPSKATTSKTSTNEKPKVTPKPKNNSLTNKSNSDATAKVVNKPNTSSLHKSNTTDTSKPAASKFPVIKNSNVAALQQKFENQK